MTLEQFTGKQLYKKIEERRSGMHKTYDIHLHQSMHLDTVSHKCAGSLIKKKMNS